MATAYLYCVDCKCHTTVVGAIDTVQCCPVCMSKEGLWLMPSAQTNDFYRGRKWTPQPQ